MMTLNEIKDILISLIIKPGLIHIDDPDYRTMHDNLTNYIFVNKLDKTKEWNIIANNLITTTREIFVKQEADNILREIENLKILELKNSQLSKEDKIFIANLHPLIQKVATTSYLNGEYANAIESAYKEINHRLKILYKHHRGVELDGVQLMEQIFSFKNEKNTRLLVFEDMSTDSGKNVQKGYAKIFAGTIEAIRNPKCHENMTATKESAYDRLILASLLMKKVDEAISFSNIKE